MISLPGTYCAKGGSVWSRDSFKSWSFWILEARHSTLHCFPQWWNTLQLKFAENLQNSPSLDGAKAGPFAEVQYTRLDAAELKWPVDHGFWLLPGVVLLYTIIIAQHLADSIDLFLFFPSQRYPIPSELNNQMGPGLEPRPRKAAAPAKSQESIRESRRKGIKKPAGYPWFNGEYTHIVIIYDNLW